MSRKGQQGFSRARQHGREHSCFGQFIRLSSRFSDPPDMFLSGFWTNLMCTHSGRLPLSLILVLLKSYQPVISCKAILHAVVNHIEKVILVQRLSTALNSPWIS